MKTFQKMLKRCYNLERRMKSELGVKIAQQFIEFKTKTCSYIIDDSTPKKKKQKVQKVCSKNKFNLKIIKIVCKHLSLKNKKNLRKDKIDVERLKIGS